MGFKNKLYPLLRPTWFICLVFCFTAQEPQWLTGLDWIEMTNSSIQRQQSEKLMLENLSSIIAFGRWVDIFDHFDRLLRTKLTPSPWKHIWLCSEMFLMGCCLITKLFMLLHYWAVEYSVRLDEIDQINIICFSPCVFRYCVVQKTEWTMAQFPTTFTGQYVCAGLQSKIDTKADVYVFLSELKAHW